MTARGLALAIAAPRLASAAERRVTLRNEAIEFSMAFAHEMISARSFRNRLTNEVFDLPLDEVALEFEGGEMFKSSAAKAKLLGHSVSGLRLELIWKEVVAEVQYELQAGKGYLRKQVTVRSMGPERRLLRADLENWKGPHRDWTSMTADKLKFGSHPIHCDTIFAGVEFVAAFNEYGEDGFILRSRPGGIRVGSEPYLLNSTVVGVSRRGLVRQAFLDYLEDVRVAPTKLVVCYNSWWTLPLAVKQEDNLHLIGTLKERLYDRHGVFFDIVTIDGGWSERRSVWQIDRTNLPNGLDDARSLVESAGGQLGLWMSPSEFYPECCDYDWLEKQGYVVLRHEREGKQVRFALSLADPKYRSAATEQLPRLIRDNNLAHIKYDGFAAQEPIGHHDLLSGEDSVEPLAHYSLELLRVSKKANPSLVTEQTFMNSMVNYISPWILKYSTSVWANGGGDCPVGIVPAPDYRESSTNARDFYIFSSLQEVWVPQNAAQYFDIIHCDDAGGFPNHAAMAFARGRFFVPAYINPRFMQDDDWRIYAGLLKWARVNQDILRNTEVLASRVELGEPYVYAHWLGSRGIIAVRNPSNVSCSFNLDMGAGRTPKDLTGAVCYTQYPYRKGIATGVGGRSVVPLKLAPWELLILEIVPESELREPVAIGARWFNEEGRTVIVPDRGSETVEWLDPRGSADQVRVIARAEPELRGRILEQSARPLWDSDWLTGNAGKIPSIGFVIDCEVTIPASASGRLLLLIEFPGRGYWPSLFNATLNEEPVTLTGSSSDGHVGYPLNQEPWKGAIQPFESHWKWYECQVPGGSSRVKFVGTVGSEHAKIGMYLWSEEDLKQFAHPLTSTSSTPAMPEYRANIERDGICIRQPARIALTSSLG